MAEDESKYPCSIAYFESHNICIQWKVSFCRRSINNFHWPIDDHICLCGSFKRFLDLYSHRHLNNLCHNYVIFCNHSWIVLGCDSPSNVPFFDDNDFHSLLLREKVQSWIFTDQIKPNYEERTWKSDWKPPWKYFTLRTREL